MKRNKFISQAANVFSQNDGSNEFGQTRTPVEFEGRLPFMEPKRRRTENTLIPQQCYKRVKCFVETDAGFAPTTSKTDLAHKNQFTVALRNLGRKPDDSSPMIHVDIVRDGKRLSINQLDKEYQEWLKAMHESYDEEVECCDEQAVWILNPSNGKDLGISNNVVRVLTQIKRKGQLWKACQRIKIVKGATGGKAFYATLEYFLCEGIDGDPGEARMICRPMECPEDHGSKLVFNNGNGSFELGISKSLPLDLISSGKCQAVDDKTWTKQFEKKRLKAPAFIDILNTEQVHKFDVDKGFPKGVTVQAGFDLPKEIIAVVRPHSFTADNMDKIIDGTDQKYIVKECREMKMDIKDVREYKCAPESSVGNDVKFTMQTKASSRKGVNGLYCFSMEGYNLLEMFTKVGRYRFIFSLVNSSDANTLCTEIDLRVEASDNVGYWKVSNQMSDPEGVEFKQLKVRDEVAVRFPTTSSKQTTSLKQNCIYIEEKLKQKMKMKKKLEDEIEQISNALEKSKEKFEQKNEDLKEYEDQAANLSSC